MREHARVTRDAVCFYRGETGTRKSIRMAGSGMASCSWTWSDGEAVFSKAPVRGEIGTWSSTCMPARGKASVTLSGFGESSLHSVAVSPRVSMATLSTAGTAVGTPSAVDCDFDSMVPSMDRSPARPPEVDGSEAMPTTRRASCSAIAGPARASSR
jgi:hypothetical protein